MADDKQVNTGVKPKLTAQEWAEEYRKLVEKGFRIVAVPTWVTTNHGTFEMTIQYTIGENPKSE